MHPARATIIRDALTSVAILALVLALIVVSGAIWGKKPSGWVCDDTPFTRTGPVGFDVVGPTVRPIPGCGE
ncbi:MAG: hypothetical protein ACKVVP_03480 [Chloroflexota bacterium]